MLKVETAAETLGEVVKENVEQARARGGKLIWLQESTTGWVRMKALVQSQSQGQAEFLMANVLQLPLPPKALRRKTDKIDTARLLREFLHGDLPLAYQPDEWYRHVRRLVAMRENLVKRRTSLRNWINRFLAHETWDDRVGLWSKRGQQRLKELTLLEDDRMIIDLKLEELEALAKQLEKVELQMLKWYHSWPDAQQLDAIRGIAPISAVSILARIGTIARFANAEQLIAFAGLAPGIRQSDEKSRGGRLGGGGTDRHLRTYVLEATSWARELPRYRQAYQRVQRRRGNKIGRLVVARMLLRSMYKMLRDHVAFCGEGTTAQNVPQPTAHHVS
jgi:transposase